MRSYQDMIIHNSSRREYNLPSEIGNVDGWSVRNNDVAFDGWSIDSECLYCFKSSIDDLNEKKKRPEIAKLQWLDNGFLWDFIEIKYRFPHKAPLFHSETIIVDDGMKYDSHAME